MTPLEAYCEDSGLDPVEAMNILQANGVVSDNCVTIEDVALADQPKAVAHLIRVKNDEL